MSAGPSTKRPKTYHFHSEWENDFFFTSVNSKAVCLICQASITTAKKGNVERHFKTIHKTYDTEFPPKSELRKKRVKELKSQLAGQQAIFTRPLTKSKAATIASFKVSHILAKHKKPYEDGELVKEAFLGAADSLFNDFKNKSEITAAINEIQLSRNTVTRRSEMMGDNVRTQLKRDIDKCVFFSLQFDESTDVIDTSQLCIFIRMVFENMSTKEELLKIIPMKGKTRGEDVYRAFKDFIRDSNLPIFKLVSMTTDGAPSMTGRTNGFIALCHQDKDFPDFLSYHCIIHQQALCGKILNMDQVMDISMKIVQSIRARSLQRRLFRSQLEDSEHTELLLHCDVRWLSRGKFLQRFRDLKDEIKTFLATRDAEYKQLEDPAWLLDLAFLTDITAKLNELNIELQGKEKNITEMISAVKSFKQKLRMLSSQLERHELRNYKNLASELESQGKSHANYDSARYIEQIQSISTEFDRRFTDFAKLEPVAAYMCFPFAEDLDVSNAASKMATLFQMDTSVVENEMINLQCDIQLKPRIADVQFWTLLDDSKYPSIRKCAMHLKAFFGSTYLCESAFSDMKIIKSKYRSTLTDEHLDNCLRLALSSYIPAYEDLADALQCKASSSSM